jgi:hypothetical protein
MWARVKSRSILPKSFFLLMSRKKKKLERSNAQAPDPAPSPSVPSSDQFVRQMTFDAMEDRIRGEELLQMEQNKKLKEAQDVKKKLDSVEVDRRLEELRKQIGLKK